MNANNFTTKALEALSNAQQEAFNNGHPQLETIHMLKGMLDADTDSLPFLDVATNPTSFVKVRENLWRP